MTAREYVDDGFDDFLDAIEDGDGYYLQCPDSHGVLPPRRVCPHCGSTELTEERIPDTGTITTFTEIHVPLPAFESSAPFVVAIAAFGPVTITAQLLHSSASDVSIGDEVVVAVDTSKKTDDRLLVFELH